MRLSSQRDNYYLCLKLNNSKPARTCRCERVCLYIVSHASSARVGKRLLPMSKKHSMVQFESYRGSRLIHDQIRHIFKECLKNKGININLLSCLRVVYFLPSYNGIQLFRQRFCTHFHYPIRQKSGCGSPQAYNSVFFQTF